MKNNEAIKIVSIDNENHLIEIFSLTFDNGVISKIIFTLYRPVSENTL